MTALPYPLRPLTAAEYAALPDDADGRYELQEGMRVMSPRPIPVHQRCLRIVCAQLDAQLPPGLEVLPEVDIDLQLVPPDQPGTVRVPDVVVTREAFDRVGREGGLLRASEVLLAIEVFSPDSYRRDARIKRGEYADAGIGHYWMIDLEDGPSLLACHLAGAFGYADHGPVRGRFATTDPFPVEIDLDALVDRT
ncbi:Uma2 family endonuclease [Pseudonocardia sp. CA-107938]|uniref:Uma2 family endonuclease n=1 Tax=Pseudonocardia sp. CA-107938 TaxID=3240021 RepID=UPI003D90BFD3